MNCEKPRELISLLVNKSLMTSPFVDFLGSEFKVKGSDVTPKDSVIMPRSAVAILLIYASKIKIDSSKGSSGPSFSDRSDAQRKNAECYSETEEELIERLKTFYKNHQKTIAIMVSAVFGEEELNCMTSRLMLKLLPRCPHFLVAHGEAQAANHVQMIAKAVRVEARHIVRSRISERFHMALSQDIFQYLARAMGISKHEMSVLMDSFQGSFKAVASVTSPEEIYKRTPLERSTAEAIFDFLNKDTVII